LALAHRLHWDAEVVLDLYAHLDDSWDERFLCLTSVLAPIHAWSGLEAAWTDALRSCRDGSLKEFKAESCRHGNRAFQGWPGNERLELRDLLLERASAAPLFTVGASIDMAAFNKVRDEQPILGKTYAHPYYLAFGALLVGLAFTQATVNIWHHLPEQGPSGDFLADVRTVRAAASTHAMDFRLGILADRNDQRAGRLVEIFNYFRDRHEPRRLPLRELVFADSMESPGIQVADLVGYEIRLFLLDFLYGGRGDATKWPSGLHRMIEPDRPNAVHIVHFDEERLRSTADSFVAQRRGDVRSIVESMTEDWSLAAWLSGRAASTPVVGA
jgi:hypothetical protein